MLHNKADEVFRWVGQLDGDVSTSMGQQGAPLPFAVLFLCGLDRQGGGKLGSWPWTSAVIMRIEMAGGRPRKYTDKLAETICRRIAEGESLRGICRDKGMPSRETINVWRTQVPGFSDQYARARELQADAFTEQILEECREAKAAGDSTAVAASRLMVDSLKWLAGKQHPRVYGDRINLDHSGEIKTVAEMSDEQLNETINTLMARLHAEGD